MTAKLGLQGVSGSRITRAELAKAGKTADHQISEALPRMRNREKGDKPVHSQEGGGVEKAT